MKTFEFIEGITSADYAFQSFGKNYNELFINSALAVMSCQVDLKSVKKKVKKLIVLKNDNIETLLFDFLNKILYFKDAECLIFNDVKVLIKKSRKLFVLKATFYGAIINPVKQKLGVDIKAITYHQFSIKKIKNGFKATIVLDA